MGARMSAGGLFIDASEPLILLCTERVFDANFWKFIFSVTYFNENLYILNEERF